MAEADATNKAFLVLWIMFICACIDQILFGVATCDSSIQTPLMPF